MSLILRTLRRTPFASSCCAHQHHLFSSSSNDADKPRQGIIGKSFSLPRDNPTSVFGDDWISVYRFPYIVATRVIQRMKIYQTVLTCGVFLPVSVVSAALKVIPEETAAFILGASGFACVMLYCMGTFADGLIGIIYVTDKDPSLVRIASMNFWGSRKDQVFLKNDFVPFTDLRDKLDDVYICLDQYSDPTKKLKLSVKYGKILDREKFYEIFGGGAATPLQK